MTPAGLIRHGTTSACAENTALECAPARDQQNYLRVRGEYTGPVAGIDSDLELPPRARRIPSLWIRLWVRFGTTSACAENTDAKIVVASQFTNYLRVRGEYTFDIERADCFEELPPRARRIRVGSIDDFVREGTTSACAENTLPAFFFAVDPRNYLRVRGEYLHSIMYTDSRWELPPRARRIQSYS